MSDEEDESEGVKFSTDGARRKVSKLLQAQETLLIPSPCAVFFAAVRSQCRLMKIGMSEKARNL